MNRPSGLLKRLFDAPAGLYRTGFGGLLGHRVLALTHRGRTSGKVYDTVLEVVLFDPVSQESIVGSAWGEQADWYRNIRAQPALRIRTGRLDYRPVQRFLTPEEAADAAREFCRRHPLEARLIHRVLPAIGAAIEADPERTPAELLADLPMVGFRPEA